MGYDYIVSDTLKTYPKITGNFTREEIEDLVNVLSSGSMPFSLKRVGLKYVGDGP